MEKIKQFVNELNMENGSNYKNAVLKKYKEDEDVRWFLKYYFDPFSITNLSTKKLSKNVDVEPLKDIKTFRECLLFASTKCSGKDQDISTIQTFINKHEEDREFIEGCIAKNITFGISPKSINKVFGKGFIFVVELQLAEKYFDNKKYVKEKRFALTLKLDGIRCLAFKRDGKVTLMSRQGQPIEEANDIINELSNIEYDNFVFDGELLVEGWQEMDSKDVYKATTKIVRKNGPKSGIKLVVFDMVSIKAWDKRKGYANYDLRRLRFEKRIEGCKFVESVPLLYKGYDVDKIEKILEKVKVKNQEGLMINICEAEYQFKRTKDLLKVKVMQDCDLKVIGVQEGKGKYKGTLGALVVKYKGNTINVGSGLSDILRNKIWNNQKAIIDRVIKVQYFEETQDSFGNKSLRFPVFLEICPKGKEPSIH